MVAKPLCPLYKNIIKHLDRARYPELRYFYKKNALQHHFLLILLLFLFENMLLRKKILHWKIIVSCFRDMMIVASIKMPLSLLKQIF